MGSLWLGRGCEVARQSRDAQKLLFQPILRCSDFYVIDLNELTQYGKQDFEQKQSYYLGNKAGYTATLVACGWAGAVIEEATGAFGQEQ